MGCHKNDTSGNYSSKDGTTVSEWIPGCKQRPQMALEEAVRNSVRREILDEMNRLKRENEELQDVKEHFDEVKANYERKKAECDRIIADAE